MPDLVDFAPQRRPRSLLGDYEALVRLAMIGDVGAGATGESRGGFPVPDVGQSVRLGFAAGQKAGPELRDLWQRLFGQSQGRSPQIEPAYQAHRAGERASY